MALNVPLAIRMTPYFAKSAGWKDQVDDVCGLQSQPERRRRPGHQGDGPRWHGREPTSGAPRGGQQRVPRPQWLPERVQNDPDHRRNEPNKVHSSLRNKAFSAAEECHDTRTNVSEPDRVSFLTKGDNA
jgi:hypothetical protein